MADPSGDARGQETSGLFDGEVLWHHRDPSSTLMWKFLQHVIEKHPNLNLDDKYRELFEWSTTDVTSFWEEVWHFIGLKSDVPPGGSSGYMGVDVKNVSMSPGSLSLGLTEEFQPQYFINPHFHMPSARTECSCNQMRSK